MWHITAPTPQARAGHPIAAPAPLACTCCEHAFAPNSPVLSDAPEALPPGVDRTQLRHFHLVCEECESGSVPCYQTYASRQPTHVAEEEVNCIYCGEAIWLRQRFAVDYVLLLGGEDDALGEPSPALLLLLSRIASKRTPFDGLSSATRWRFVRGGLGGNRGLRNSAEAADFYRRSVPWAIQAQGEQAVLDFIDGKVASHLRSVANSPHLARDPRNIVWEAAKKNQTRGAKDMSRLDKLNVQAKNMAATGKFAARSALRAAMWEAPISAVENSIRVFRGGLSKKRAAENTVKDTGRAAASTGVIMFAMAVTGLKVGFLLHPVTRTIGTGIFAVSTAQRLRRAWQESSALPESPLTPLVLYFHPDCYSRYAAEVSAPPTDPGESEPSALAS